MLKTLDLLTLNNYWIRRLQVTTPTHQLLCSGYISKRIILHIDNLIHIIIK